ncbi:hypothetical protein KC333_g3979 [Hortaea werneckii]|nr:hypothetical protein KC333_g3979 [Hortaea werneckii]KAI7316900.1 hypothetical protein KC326_g4221 [Hortaea werneckii]
MVALARCAGNKEWREINACLAGVPSRTHQRHRWRVQDRRKYVDTSAIGAKATPKKRGKKADADGEDDAEDAEAGGTTSQPMIPPPGIGAFDQAHSSGGEDDNLDEDSITLPSPPARHNQPTWRRTTPPPNVGHNPPTEDRRDYHDTTTRVRYNQPVGRSTTPREWGTTSQHEDRRHHHQERHHHHHHRQGRGTIHPPASVKTDEDTMRVRHNQPA